MLASVDLAPKEPGALEDAKVFRDRIERDVEGFGEIGDPRFAERQASEDEATRRIGDRRQGVIEPRRLMLNHTVEYFRAGIEPSSIGGLRLTHR